VQVRARSFGTEVPQDDSGTGKYFNAALETGGIMAGDEVAINLDIQFIKRERRAWVQRKQSGQKKRA
jgi:hypothetical protein